MEPTANFQTSARYIAQRMAGRQPETAIVLGSGLGRLAEQIDRPIVIPYARIPHFAQSTALGHRGNLVSGTLGGRQVLAMQGRFHYYEGYGMDEVVYPIRTMYWLGIKNLLVSNAAGGVNDRYRVGDLMVIDDHINLLPNPLVGKNVEAMGPRFPDMTRPYDPELIRLAEQVAGEMNIPLQKGVYLAGTGPSYETPAEYRFFRLIGADAVGMSTIPEVITARHGGMRVFGLSVITNEAHGHFAPDFVNSGQEVVAAADAAAGVMTRLFAGMIERL